MEKDKPIMQYPRDKETIQNIEGIQYHKCPGFEEADFDFNTQLIMLDDNI